jgi:hypothetical protein
MRSLTSVLVCVTLAFTAGRLFAGETVANQALGVRLSVPDGFVQDKTKVAGDVIFAFIRPAAAGEKANSGIIVSRMRGVMGRDKIDPKLLAKAPHVSLVSEKWKTFDLEVMRVPEKIAGLDLVTFNAQVPLKPEAIQLSVAGEASHEAELRTILRTVLATVDGQTNWLTTEERVNRGAQGIVGIAITLVVILFLGGLAWRGVRWLSGGSKPPEPPA